MNNSLGSLDPIIEAIADRVAKKLLEQIPSPDRRSGIRPRLLSVHEAAAYLGRSANGVQHLIAQGTIPTVRHDSSRASTEATTKYFGIVLTPYPRIGRFGSRIIRPDEGFGNKAFVELSIW